MDQPNTSDSILTEDLDTEASLLALDYTDVRDRIASASEGLLGQQRIYAVRTNTCVLAVGLTCL